MKRLIQTTVATLLVATSLAGLAGAVRMSPLDYVEGADARQVGLPFAWGVHFRNGESQGWKLLWVRVKADAPAKAEVVVNGTATTHSLKTGDNWLKAGFSGTWRELRFEVRGGEGAKLEEMLLSDGTFDPSNVARTVLDALPRRMPRTETVDRFFERNPLMDVQAFAEKAARLIGCEPVAKAPVTDENGAILFNGKPYFPLMIYHAVGRNDQVLDSVPFNLYADYVPNRPSPYERHQMFTGIMFRDWTYTDYIAEARGAAGNKNISMLYLFDEPDLHYDEIGCRRLHALCKAVNQTPTIYCYCMFCSAKACDTSDYVCFDHYPIGKNDPWFSVEAIGWMVDRARFSRGNAPVLFAPQTYDNVVYGKAEHFKYNEKEGGMPTERELVTMTFLPIAHGARGLMFFNFRNIHSPKGETMPEAYPESWATLSNMVFQIHAMEPALVGPEVKLPWRVSGEGIARLLVSDDRKMGYLLVVNPKLHAITMHFAPEAKNPLAKARFETVLNYGAEPTFEADGKIRIVMEELGTLLYRLSPETLGQLEKKTTEEILAELKARTRCDANCDEATRLGRRGQVRPVKPEKKQKWER